MRNRLVIILIAIIVTNLILFITEDISQTLISCVKPFLISSGLKKGVLILVDEKGVPFVEDYRFSKNKSSSKQRNPVAISQKVFEYFDQYVNGDTSHKKYIINCVNWLMDNAAFKDSAALLVYHSPNQVYNLIPPWYSGMAQGQALKALIIAHKINQNDGYLEFGDKLLKTFYIDVKDDGVTYLSENDGWWYEEFASSKAMESKVLNGMMFALAGLYEYYEYTKNPMAIFLFNQGIKSLNHRLPIYDKDGYSYYDQLGQPAGWHYHKVHIELLDKFYKITKKERFKEYRDRWNGYYKKPFIVRTFLNPSLMGYGILLLNFAFSLLILETILIILTLRKNLNNHT